MSTAEHEMHVRRGSIVFPFVLISVGIVVLLNNLGTLSWDIWFSLLRMWPVLLIAAGIDVLIGRRSVLGSLIVIALLVAALGVAIWMTGSGPATGGQLLTTRDISQPLNGATKADVQLSAGATALRVAAAQEDAGLVEGQVAYQPNERVNLDAHNSGDTAYFSLRSQNASINWMGRTEQWRDRVWDLKLNRSVPMSLRINTGVGQTSLDLTRLNLTDLRVESGVGQTTLTLPVAGRLQASVNAGVGELTVLVPNGMAARIQVEAGLSHVQVDGNFNRHDREYTSPNYNSATNRVELRINGGIGQITVRELPGE